MKKFTIQAVLLLTIITVGLIFFAPIQNAQKIEIPFLPSSPKYQTLQINGATLRLEVADTTSKRNKGLGGRESLASDSGMLFVFEREGSYPFWMKGMKFSLDLIWLKGDKVVDIIKNVQSPTPSQKDSDLPIYQSKEVVDKVLELNSGSADRLSIKTGDTLKVQ